MISEESKSGCMLLFKRDELLYDCKNLGYIAGDVTKTNNIHSRHQLQDIGEKGNVDWVTRVLGLGIARCRELLYPYSRVPVGDGVGLDDELDEPNAYVIELVLPADFSMSTVTLLKHWIHMLLVYMVMEEWVGLTDVDNINSRAHWSAKIAEALKEIEDTKNLRSKVFTRRSDPF